MERFYYDPAMDQNATFHDRMLMISIGLGGPLMEQCDFIFNLISSHNTDRVEVNGGAMGIAASIFLAAKGLDVMITFPWDRTWDPEDEDFEEEDFEDWG